MDFVVGVKAQRAEGKTLADARETFGITPKIFCDASILVEKMSNDENLVVRTSTKKVGQPPESSIASIKADLLTWVLNC